jgi:hypothetical protein
VLFQKWRRFGKNLFSLSQRLSPFLIHFAVPKDGRHHCQCTPQQHVPAHSKAEQTHWSFAFSWLVHSLEQSSGPGHCLSRPLLSQSSFDDSLSSSLLLVIVVIDFFVEIVSLTGIARTKAVRAICKHSRLPLPGNK